jgi:hypothetical protein
MLILYSLALPLLLILGAPWWLFRMATSGKYREGLPERLGLVPDRIRHKLDGRKVVWIHAVSVGEVLAVSRLIEELDARLAQSGGQRAQDRHWRGRGSARTVSSIFLWTWAGRCGRGCGLCSRVCWC